MTETALTQFWQLIAQAIALQPQAFEKVQTLPSSNLAMLLIVFLAGFSQTVGQSIVLFVNKVKPIRFILSLLIAAILYAFSYGFWAVSTWGVTQILFAQGVSLISIGRTLGLAYAPQVFGFLVALPYLGVPIFILISVWSLVAFVMGLETTLELTSWQAFWCAALGWVVLQIVQRTLGKPVTVIGEWLQNSVAGVQLVTSLPDFEQFVKKFPRQNQTD